MTHGSKVAMTMRRCHQKRHDKKQVATRRGVFGFSWNLLVAHDSSCHDLSFFQLVKKVVTTRRCEKKL